MKQDIKLSSILIKGAFYGWVSAVIGFSIFLLLIQVLMTIRHDPISVKFLSVGFFYGSLISSFPAIFVGSFIAFLIRYDQLHNSFSLRMSILKGALLGSFTGLGISLFASVIFRRGDLLTYLVYSILVIILASISGGWTARKIALITKNEDTEQPIDALV